LAELDHHEMYDILQVSPMAEPEVVAAAYRALAKKYHPDRSDAPDAMNRMARLNIAYQTLQARLPRSTPDEDSSDISIDPGSVFSGTTIDSSGTLQDLFRMVGQRIAAARQEVVDEIVKTGVARDVATNLVVQAVKETFQIDPVSNGQATNHASGHIDSNSSYDDALKLTIAMATSARDAVADSLVHDGLQRGVATELADSAFERIRKSRDTSQSRNTRLSSDRVDLSGSLERGMDVVLAKTKIARQMVVDEIAQDGVPTRTAEQLVRTAFEKLLKSGGK